MKIIVTHSSHFDFREKLYKPLRDSVLNHKHDIFLPQEKGKERITKDLVKSCDVVLAEVSLPSTGQGIELGWADTFGVPIICIQETGNRRSYSLLFITNTFIEYKNAADMLEKIELALKLIDSNSLT